MPYIDNGLFHDADSHLMEMPDCLDHILKKSSLGDSLVTRTWEFG